MSGQSDSKRTSLTQYTLMWVILFALAVSAFNRETSTTILTYSVPASHRYGDQLKVLAQGNPQGHCVTTGKIIQYVVDRVTLVASCARMCTHTADVVSSTITRMLKPHIDTVETLTFDNGSVFST